MNLQVSIRLGPTMIKISLHWLHLFPPKMTKHPSLSGDITAFLWVVTASRPGLVCFDPQPLENVPDNSPSQRDSQGSFVVCFSFAIVSWNT